MAMLRPGGRGEGLWDTEVDVSMRCSVVQNSVSWETSGWYRHHQLKGNHEDMGVCELTVCLKSHLRNGCGVFGQQSAFVLHLQGFEDETLPAVQKSTCVSVRTPLCYICGTIAMHFLGRCSALVSKRKGRCLVQPNSGSRGVRKKLYHFSWHENLGCKDSPRRNCARLWKWLLSLVFCQSCRFFWQQWPHLFLCTSGPLRIVTCTLRLHFLTPFHT